MAHPRLPLSNTFYILNITPSNPFIRIAPVLSPRQYLDHDLKYLKIINIFRPRHPDKYKY
jgi:hypothetical protein